MRSLAVLTSLVLALGMAGCQAQSEAKEDEAVSTGAAEDEIVTPELTAEEADTRAFFAAWEAAAPVTASDPRLNDEEDVRWPEPTAGSYEFRDGDVIQLSTDLYALVSRGYGQGSTGKGVLAFHYLTRTADGFRRVGAEPLFIAGGVNGQPPTFTVHRDLMPAPAVVVTTRTEGRTGACSVAQIVELAPSQPVLRVVNLPLGFEASGSGQGWQGEPEAGRAGRDFAVQYSGASEAKATWILTDAGTYRASGQPRLSGC